MCVCVCRCNGQGVVARACAPAQRPPAARAVPRLPSPCSPAAGPTASPARAPLAHLLCCAAAGAGAQGVLARGGLQGRQGGGLDGGARRAARTCARVAVGVRCSPHCASAASAGTFGPWPTQPPPLNCPPPSPPPVLLPRLPLQDQPRARGGGGIQARHGGVRCVPGQWRVGKQAGGWVAGCAACHLPPPEPACPPAHPSHLPTPPTTQRPCCASTATLAGRSAAWGTP